MLLERPMVLNISFYHSNKDKLKHHYAGRYLLIKDEKIIGDFNGWLEACKHGLQIFNNDNFFIKYCA